MKVTVSLLWMIILCNTLFARVNFEQEAKKVLRPFGKVLQEGKEKFQSVFVTPSKHLNYVRGNSFSQIHVSRGRLGRTQLGAALPDKSAVGRTIKVYYPPTGRSVRVRVRDTGPYFVRDPYWKYQRRPYAETQPSTWIGQPIPDRSAISLSPQVWYKLGVRRNLAFSGAFQGVVGWRFLD